MKAKKAVKRLNEVEALLSDVIDHYAATDKSLRELLDSAKESVFRAKESVSEQEKPAKKKTSAVKRKGARRETKTPQAVAKAV